MFCVMSNLEMTCVKFSVTYGRNIQGPHRREIRAKLLNITGINILVQRIGLEKRISQFYLF